MRRRLRYRLSAVAVFGVLAAGVLAATGRTDEVGVRVSHLGLVSRRVHATMAMTIVAPAGGGAGRPLLVFLHGRGADQDSELSSGFLRALHALGRRAPDVVFPYGGDHSYWHNRRGGAWADYVIDEVIPTAARALHADGRAVAIGGISMGGFGAYDIARLHPGRFCAVGGHSAALWPSAGATAPGAFDDAADFARHDLIAAVAGHPHLYGGARLWLDGGDADPFHAADEALARELGVRMHVWPGGHDGDYWNRHWSDYLGFYAAALSRCHALRAAGRSASS